jgi:hypothetical protein
MELAYLAVARGEPDEARRLFASAEEGDDPDLRARASAERAAMAKPAAARPSAASSPVDSTLAEAYRLKSEREFEAAAAAFTRAQAAGADPQRIAMELGYVAAARGSSDDMRTYFSAAANGPDRVIADRAKSEMAYLPRRFWGDLYADAYGWQRAAGEDRGGSLVPTVRVRGMVRPALSLDFNLYIYGQATRDTGSRGSVAGGPPRIFADDYALVGAGAMVRFWGGRVGLFAQIGPAFNLIDDGRERAAVDGRGGGVLYAETSRCAPSPAHGAWAGFLPCLETYAEVVYVSRFDNNVIAFGRPRVAGSYLVTGPVAWQVVAEARAAADRNGDYYNNLVDGGAGHRWRLLAPLRIDALFSVNAGTYFGVTNRDPAPSRLSYADLRLNLATYAEF